MNKDIVLLYIDRLIDNSLQKHHCVVLLTLQISWKIGNDKISKKII